MHTTQHIRFHTSSDFIFPTAQCLSVERGCHKLGYFCAGQWSQVFMNQSKGLINREQQAVTFAGADFLLSLFFLCVSDLLTHLPSYAPQSRYSWTGTKLGLKASRWQNCNKAVWARALICKAHMMQASWLWSCRFSETDSKLTGP